MHTHYIDQDLDKQAVIKEAFTTLTNTSREKSPQLYILSYSQKLMIFAGTYNPTSNYGQSRLPELALRYLGAVWNHNFHNSIPNFYNS